MSKNAKSILTEAMLNAQDGVKNEDAMTEEIEGPEAASRKKLIRKALIATAAAAVATFIVVKLAGSTETEDATETPED